MTALAPERCAARVELEAFEGTLDLLVELVRRDEGMLLHLELCRMTEQLLEQTDRLPFDDAGVAIVLSAQLVHLKMKLLLRVAGAPDAAPSFDVDEDTLALLLECKELVRELREEGGGRVGRGTAWVEPGSPNRARARKTDGEASTAPPTRTFTLDELDAELADLQREIAGTNILAREPYPRAQVLATLWNRLEGRAAIGFDEFGGEPLGYRVALFLGVLEEARGRRLRLTQDSPLHELVMQRVEEGA